MQKPQIIAHFFIPADQHAPEAIHPTMRAFHHPSPCLETGFLLERLGLFPSGSDVDGEPRVSAFGLPCSHLKERVSIPPRPLTSRFDAAFMTRFSSQQMQRPMAQDRHIFGSMALANATIVFPKADIKDPMERIFHAQCCRTAWAKRTASPGREVKKQRCSLETSPPTSRCDSTRPTRAILAHEPCTPQHSMSAVIQ